MGIGCQKAAVTKKRPILATTIKEPTMGTIDVNALRQQNQLTNRQILMKLLGSVTDEPTNWVEEPKDFGGMPKVELALVNLDHYIKWLQDLLLGRQPIPKFQAPGNQPGAELEAAPKAATMPLPAPGSDTDPLRQLLEQLKSLVTLMGWTPEEAVGNFTDLARLIGAHDSGMAGNMWTVIGQIARGEVSVSSGKIDELEALKREKSRLEAENARLTGEYANADAERIALKGQVAALNAAAGGGTGTTPAVMSAEDKEAFDAIKDMVAKKAIAVDPGGMFKSSKGFTVDPSKLKASTTDFLNEKAS
jgi:hypothetical protein